MGLTGVLSSVRSYLSTRFPIGSQGGTVLSAYACCYVLYGQVNGSQVFRWPTVVGGITVVLLALVRRIVDDVEDLREDIRSNRFAFADGGRRHLRGLVLGGLTATAIAAILNATCSLGLFATSVGIAAWFPVAMVIKNKTAVSRSRALKYIVVETCPAAFLLYSYAAWTVASGDSISVMAVVAIIGLFWTTYQFWNFTRKVGAEGWPPWGLTLSETRPALIIFLILAATFSALIAHYANLSVAYLLYGLALSVIFASIILRWWSQLPTSEPNRVGASWGGLPFAIAVEVGVLIAVLL